MNRVDEFYDEFLGYIDKTFADLSAWESAQLAQNELKNELGESLATSVVSAHLDENPKEIFSGKNDEFTYTLHSFDGLISPNEIIIYGANENPKELVDLRLNAGATGVVTARPAKLSGLDKAELVETLKKKPSLDGFDNFTIFEGNLNRTLNRYSGVLTSNGERVRLNSITIEDYLFIPQSKANSLFHEGELLALYKTLINLKDVSKIKDIVVITDLAHDYLISNSLTTDYREKLTSFSEEYLSTPLIQRMLEEYKVYLSSQYLGFSNNYPSLYVVLDGLGIDGLKFIDKDTKSYNHFYHKPILMNLLGGFSEIESCTVKEIYELLQDDRMRVLQYVNGSDPKLLKAALRFFKTGELVD